MRFGSENEQNPTTRKHFTFRFLLGFAMVFSLKFAFEWKHKHFAICAMFNGSTISILSNSYNMSLSSYFFYFLVGINSNQSMINKNIEKYKKHYESKFTTPGFLCVSKFYYHQHLIIITISKVNRSNNFEKAVYVVWWLYDIRISYI